MPAKTIFLLPVLDLSMAPGDVFAGGGCYWAWRHFWRPLAPAISQRCPEALGLLEYECAFRASEDIAAAYARRY